MAPIKDVTSPNSGPVISCFSVLERPPQKQISMWKLILGLLAVAVAVPDDSGESYFYHPIRFNPGPRSTFRHSFVPMPVLKRVPVFSTQQIFQPSNARPTYYASKPRVDVTHVQHSPNVPKPVQQPFVPRYDQPKPHQNTIFNVRYEYDHDDGRYEIDDDHVYVANPQVYRSTVGVPMPYNTANPHGDMFKFKMFDEDDDDEDDVSQYFRSSNFGSFGIQPVPKFYSTHGTYKYDFDDDDDRFDIDDDK